MHFPRDGLADLGHFSTRTGPNASDCPVPPVVPPEVATRPPLPRTTFMMSSRVIRPDSPVPETAFKSIPTSRAKRRMAGPAATDAPAPLLEVTGAGAAGAAGVGVGAGAGAGAGGVGGAAAAGGSGVGAGGGVGGAAGAGAGAAGAGAAASLGSIETITLPTETVSPSLT